MDTTLFIREDVAGALHAGRPVVALESTVIAHGLPRPQNLETARAMEAAVLEEGALPATVAILDGRLVVGLSSEQLATFAVTDGIAKVSRADLAAAVAARRDIKGRPFWSRFGVFGLKPTTKRSALNG